MAVFNSQKAFAQGKKVPNSVTSQLASKLNTSFDFDKGVKRLSDKFTSPSDRKIIKKYAAETKAKIKFDKLKFSAGAGSTVIVHYQGKKSFEFSVQDLTKKTFMVNGKVVSSTGTDFSKFYLDINRAIQLETHSLLRDIIPRADAFVFVGMVLVASVLYMVYEDSINHWLKNSELESGRKKTKLARELCVKGFKKESLDSVKNIEKIIIFNDAESWRRDYDKFCIKRLGQLPNEIRPQTLLFCDEYKKLSACLWPEFVPKDEADTGAIETQQ